MAHLFKFLEEYVASILIEDKVLTAAHLDRFQECALRIVIKANPPLVLCKLHDEVNLLWIALTN